MSEFDSRGGRHFSNKSEIQKSLIFQVDYEFDWMDDYLVFDLWYPLHSSTKIIKKNMQRCWHWLKIFYSLFLTIAAARATPGCGSIWY